MNKSLLSQLEKWLLWHSSKLPIFNLPPNVKDKFEKIKNSETDKIWGILVNLPEVEGYTEIIITNKKVETYVSQSSELQELGIKTVFNLVIPEFNQGIVPTISELQELFEEGIEILKTKMQVTIVF